MCCSHFTGNVDPTPLYHKTGKPANLIHTRKRLASKYSDRPRSLFDAHSPRQPSVSPASPAFSAPESYFTMHASYLIIYPRFTLRVAAVTEKNGGQTDGRTHAHTHTHTHDCNNPPLRMHAITLRCACAQARVNDKGNPQRTAHARYIPLIDWLGLCVYPR